jgi:muramidase (phage lysozyme)
MARGDVSSSSLDFLSGSASLPPGALIGLKDVQGAEAAARGSLRGEPVREMSIPAQGRALLATIGGPGFESNGTYTQRFNQPDFEDFSKHPNTYARIERGPNKGLFSNAAGRYQQISTTFNEQAKKLNLTDFSPESQDKAAWNLARETYTQAKLTKGRNLEADLQDQKNLPQIAAALKSQWSSLPGGIEQGGNMKLFAQNFAANLEAELAREPGRGAPTQTALSL